MRTSKRKLLSRIQALEDYLGVSFTIDRYNDGEHVENSYATIKTHGDRLRRVEKKVFTEKELRDNNRFY